MTRSNYGHHQLDDLRLEWRSIGRSPASRRAAKQLYGHHPPLQGRGVRDLADVVLLLEPKGGLSQLERAELVTALLELAPEDPIIVRALLQTLLPGLVSVARRLDWGRGRSDDPACFLADLVTSLFELIAEWGGQHRRFAAPDLLNAVRCRMRRRLDAEGASRVLALEELGPEGLPAVIDVDPTESLEALLLAGREELDPIGAAALYGREVLGLSYREMSAMTGVTPRRLADAGRAVARRIFVQ
jgi:hypothetical protein